MNISSIRRILRSQLGEEFGAMRAIAMDRTAGDEEQYSLLLFKPDRPDPVALVKVVTSDEKRQALKREFDNLDRLRRRGDDSFKRSIPLPMYMGDHEAFSLMVESAESGTRMKNYFPSTYFPSKKFTTHFANVIAWLKAFHQTMSEPKNMEPGSVDPVIEKYRSNFDCSDRLNRMLDELPRNLAGAELPLSPLHGDFCTANLLVQETGGIVVIDWEHPMTMTWPLMDVLHFLASIWCRPYRRGMEAARINYIRLFFADHKLVNLIRDGVFDYLDHLGIDRSLLWHLSLVVWMQYANDKKAFLEKLGDPSQSDLQLPLTLFKDRTCMNVELLAERKGRYILTG